MTAEQLMTLIYSFNLILLIGLVVGLLWWQKRHGRLAANKFAALLTGYFSFSFITTLSPFLRINARATIGIDIVFLLVLWCIGYPWFRWLWKQFNSAK